VSQPPVALFELSANVGILDVTADLAAYHAQMNAWLISVQPAFVLAQSTINIEQSSIQSVVLYFSQLPITQLLQEV